MNSRIPTLFPKDDKKYKHNKPEKEFHIKLVFLFGALFIVFLCMAVIIVLSSRDCFQRDQFINVLEPDNDEPDEVEYSFSALDVSIKETAAVANHETAADIKSEIEYVRKEPSNVYYDDYDEINPVNEKTSDDSDSDIHLDTFATEEADYVQPVIYQSEIDTESFQGPEISIYSDGINADYISQSSAILQPQIEIPDSDELTQPEVLSTYVVLSKNETSEQVIALQNRLMELGYLDIDEPTNYYGSATEDAVTIFQRQHGLKTDGIAGTETQDLLYSDSAEKYCLKIGAIGNDVRNIQLQLYELGYLDKRNVDSIYGEITVNAVKQFQKMNRLTSDGLAGEMTIEILFSDSALPSENKEIAQSTATLPSIDTPKPEKTASNKRNDTILPTEKNSQNEKRDRFIASAKSKLGCNYVLGDSGPDTFDCSGFVCWGLRQSGVSVKRLNAAGYSNYSRWKKITSISELQKGDILFFKSDKEKHVNHCGIYIGSGMMIDASSGHGKVIKRSLNSYWKRNFVCARRPW